MTTYRIFGWLFPRVLAVIYIIAFLSWKVQCDALTGEHGLAPVPVFLQQVTDYAHQKDVSAFWMVPTVWWWLPFTDSHAQALCEWACVAAVWVIAGVFQGPLLLLLWAGYLSIMTTGNVFMGYQWDALLVETGWIAVLISSWRPLVTRRRLVALAPSRWQMLLPQLLLFKLMFLSGILKWESPDSSWRDFTALQYHFETQPLPTWVAWWAHQLPAWVQSLQCAIMLGIEMFVPTLIPFVLVSQFFDVSRKINRWLARFIAGSFIGLMLLIALTGNYTFFNWLTLLLSVSVLDDRCWPRGLRRLLRVEPSDPLRKKRGQVFHFA